MPLDVRQSGVLQGRVAEAVRIEHVHPGDAPHIDVGVLAVDLLHVDPVRLDPTKVHAKAAQQLLVRVDILHHAVEHRVLVAQLGVLKKAFQLAIADAMDGADVTSPIDGHAVGLLVVADGSKAFSRVHFVLAL